MNALRQTMTPAEERQWERDVDSGTLFMLPQASYTCTRCARAFSRAAQAQRGINTFCSPDCRREWYRLNRRVGRFMLP